MCEQYVNELKAEIEKLKNEKGAALTLLRIFMDFLGIFKIVKWPPESERERSVAALGSLTALEAGNPSLDSFTVEVMKDFKGYLEATKIVWDKQK